MDAQEAIKRLRKQELIASALAKSPDLKVVLELAITLFDSRFSESQNCTIVSAKLLSELFLALELPELAGYVIQERPGYVAKHRVQ